MKDGLKILLNTYNDFSFPLNRWQVKDGVNTDRFQKVFDMFYKN